MTGSDGKKHVTMRQKRGLIAVVLTLTLGITALGGCAGRTVSVKTGERVVCTYGEQVSSTVRTVKVPAKDAGKYSVATKTVTCPKHAQLEGLYAEAQSALEKEDLKTAEAKLTELVSIDATYRSAADQLSDIKAGTRPKPDTSSGSGANGGGGSAGSTGTVESGADGAKPGDSKPEGPVASLLIYTPDDIEGYKAQAVGSDVFSVSRTYLPLTGGSIDSLIVYAEQYRTPEAAKSWVAKSVKGAYTTSARNVRVGGHDAYFGTDGVRFAVIAWSNGPVAVVIEADVGAKPAAAYDQLVSIADVLPK